MKNFIFTLFSVVAVSGAAQSTWEIDKSHSSIGFEISHMLISTVSGHFGEFDIRIKGTPSPEDFAKSKVSATIEVKSIDTNNERRDGHLQSDDFFDAQNHPQITFESTSIKKISDTEYEINGDLKIRGITKPVTFKTTMTGIYKDAKGKLRTGWKSTLAINRFDYGLKWNNTMETGGLVAGDEVKITVHTEVIEK